MKTLKPVISTRYLPTQTRSVTLTLFYCLYSKVYGYPLWLDITIGFVLVLMFLSAVVKIALEDQVHPRDLP